MKKTGKKNFLRFFLVFAAAFAAVLLFADPDPGIPTAKRIMIIYVSAGGYRIIDNELRNDDYAVCLPVASGMHAGPINLLYPYLITSYDQALPDFETYCGGAPCDQVWDVRFNTAADAVPYANCIGNAAGGPLLIGPTQRTWFQNYMASSAANIPYGRTLFMLGDNRGFPCRNQGVIDLVNSVVASGTFAASGSGYHDDSAFGDDHTYLNQPIAAAMENFDTDYMNLNTCSTNGQVWAQYAGGIKMTELATGRPVYTQTNVEWTVGDFGMGATGVGFMYDDLKAPYNESKLFTWWDWQTFKNHPGAYCCDDNLSNDYLARNIMDFLIIIPTPTFTNTATSTNTIGPVSYTHLTLPTKRIV